MMKNILIILLCLYLFSCQEKKERSYLPDEKEYAADSAILLWEKEAKQDSLLGDINGLLYCYEGIYIALGEEKRSDFLLYKKKLLPLLTKAENANVAKTYKFLATAHYKNNEPDSAQKYYDLSLNIAQKLPTENAWEASQCYAEYAFFLTDIQDIAKAKIYAKEAYFLNKKDSISNNELNLARYYFLLGYEDSAFLYLNKPLINNDLQADRYRKLSEFYRNGQHQNTDSAYFYTYKLIHNLDETKPKSLGRAYKYLGEVLFKKQQYQAALDTLNMALSLRKADKIGMAATYKVISEVYLAQNQINKAIESVQKGLSNVSSVEKYSVTPPINSLSMQEESWKLLFQNVKILYEKDKKIALQAADSTDKFIDNLRNSLQSEESKWVLGDKVADFYDLAMQLCLEVAQKEKAFYFSEKKKGFLLFSSLKDLEYKQIANISPAYLAEEQRILKNLNFYKNKNKDIKKTFELHQQLGSLTQKIKKEYPAYYNLKYQTQPINLGTIQQKLKPTEAMIDYVKGGMNGAWVITKDSATFVPLPKMPSDSAVKAFFHLLENHDTRLSLYLSEAYPFYEALISPLKKYAKPSQWFIIPDGTLNYLSFDALPNPDRLTPYLLYEKSISYHYSASLWAHLAETQFVANTKENYFLAAVDEFDEKLDMPTLNAKNILSLFAKQYGEGELLFPAKKQAFVQHFDQEKSYPLICLYTHSEGNDEVSEKCRIYLKDERLNLSEIFSLQMKAGLVILASCESGKGKIHKGEGMMSLARGFLYAGGESVLPTKWSVNETVTHTLLQFLIEELAKGQSKNKALQQAKIRYLAQDSEAIPYEWAATFLVGNTEPVHFADNQPNILNIKTLFIFVIPLLLIVIFWKKRSN